MEENNQNHKTGMFCFASEEIPVVSNQEAKQTTHRNLIRDKMVRFNANSTTSLNISECNSDKQTKSRVNKIEKSKG